jgi:hypothetical protein
MMNDVRLNLAINKAYKMLEDEKERKKCVEVVDEARDRVEKMVSVIRTMSMSPFGCVWFL